MWKEITQETTLSNNRTLRTLSDWLDNKGFAGAGRAFTHAAYHAVIGSAKFICLNWKGAGAEFKRVGQQLRRVGNTPPKNAADDIKKRDGSPPKDAILR